MERYICIHGHFYQPPRENAWLEYVELQDEAYPYHDWNERIDAECYRPNAMSRILDGEGFITSIVNNYADISFDFGPTLLAWMEERSPEAYRMIIEADRQSREKSGGHGPAIAQAYNHVIMPLANERDRVTQVVWGIRDFTHRFGREPEGMWLPETAVDINTLDIMAGHGIAFTILAPHQALRVRETGAPEWREVPGGEIDTRVPYTVNLPSGRRIAVFFYNGPLSREVAFGDVLKSGEGFTGRLMNLFDDNGIPQLCHIATDGETYGHHHRFGDMALAYALDNIREEGLATITNYGQFLEKHPPVHEVQIREKSSWSCSHGVDRWWSGCGCNTGQHPDWNQAWRTPLREAVDYLRDRTAPLYEKEAARFLAEPWSARDDYIGVILDRAPENINGFLGKHALRDLSDAEKVTVLKLLELQRHAMLMFTSCGWFFDDISGIQTIQVIQYAARVIQLTRDLFGEDVESAFLERLEKAVSNDPGYGNGRLLYEKMVRPSMVGLPEVVAHYAVGSLFENSRQPQQLYCYRLASEDSRSTQCGRNRLSVGRVQITSVITGEAAHLEYGAFYNGDNVVNAGVREYRDETSYQAAAAGAAETCRAADFPETMRRLDSWFGGAAYTIKSLFRDEQRKILEKMLQSTMSSIESSYRQIYEANFPRMRFIKELGIPIPEAFHAAAELIINLDLRRAVSEAWPDIASITELVEAADSWNVRLDNAGIGFAFGKNLERLMDDLEHNPGDMEALSGLAGLVSLAVTMPFTVNTWHVQNRYWDMLNSVYPAFKERAGKGEAVAATWLTTFARLGELLHVRMR